MKNTYKSENDHINILLQKDVNYWTKKFNVPAITLVYAVTSVGSMVKDVRAWLKESLYRYDFTNMDLTLCVIYTQFFFPVQDIYTSYKDETSSQAFFY